MTANNRENCSRRLCELPPRLLRLCNGIVFSRIIAPFTLQSLIVAAIYSCSSICQRKCFHRLTGARSLASKYTTEHLNSKTLNFPPSFKLPDFNHIFFFIKLHHSRCHLGYIELYCIFQSWFHSFLIVINILKSIDIK